MITNTYNTGRFPNKMKTLQDIAAEEVAQQIRMERDSIHGDPLVYARAMSDPALSIGMLAARNKAFSNYSRQAQMASNRNNFARDLRQINQKPLPWSGLTPEMLEAHSKRKADAFSPEAIRHAVSIGKPPPPAVMHIQTPAERLEFQRMLRSPVSQLPAEFVQFVRDKLQIKIDGNDRGDVMLAIWFNYATTGDATCTVFTQLWREWSKMQR